MCSHCLWLGYCSQHCGHAPAQVEEGTPVLYHKLSELQLGAVAWVSKPQMLPSSRKAS